jgi:ubiquinone/menaquinone biosynthesis C-methylase UbiE
VVLSSFMIHHLTATDKLRTFREVRRVLSPEGGFHILDFGPPFSLLTRAQAAVMKNLERTADNFSGRILPMLSEAGFGAVREAEHGNTLFGPIAIYAAHKSGG